MTGPARREAAETMLLDRRLFLLDERRYAEFVARLDAPAEPSEALRKVLSTQSP